MPNPFNDHVIEEFRANSGRLSGPFEDARILLLTTTGARTGRPHTTPVAYLPEEDGCLVVLASAGGSPRHPDWYINLLALPRATVEDGLFAYEVTATVLEGTAYEETYARAAEYDEGWARYQEQAGGRRIPVVRLAPAESGPPGGPHGSLARTVRTLHDSFRRELRLLRAEFARSGPSLGAQLRINCLTLCQGMQNHHTGEDRHIFPALRERWPELTPALDELHEQHQQLSVLLAALQEVVRDPDAVPDRAAAEVGRLTLAVEAHLDHEEAQVLEFLDL